MCLPTRIGVLDCDSFWSEPFHRCGGGQPIRVNSPINVFDVFVPTCVRCKNPVSTHAGTVCV
jgi:hypothetical protein